LKTAKERGWSARFAFSAVFRSRNVHYLSVLFSWNTVVELESPKDEELLEFLLFM